MKGEQQVHCTTEKHINVHVCMIHLHVFGCHMRAKCLRATVRMKG